MSVLKQLHAMQYFETSRLSRDDITNFSPLNISKAPLYKSYPEADRYTLPTTWDLEEKNFSKLLQKRRSRRKFSNRALPIQTLAFLLWASQGVTASAGKHLFRTSPSAGALYPIETYISVQFIEGLKPGLYHFDPKHFELEHIRHETIADDIAMAALGQQFLNQAAVTFIWSAVFRRNFSKYGERGLRYVMLDAGHICQNLLLAAEATGCSGCPVAAFFDDELNEILEIDGTEESAIYMAAIGCK